MASVVIAGDTSGTVTLAAPAVAGTTTLTLPTANGTVLTTASTGISASNITTGTLPKAQLPTGSVLQVVQGTTSTQVSSNPSVVTDTGLSATITPTSSTSKILILVSQNVYVQGGSINSGAIFLLRGSTKIVTTGDYPIWASNSSDSGQIYSISYLDSPATTSSTTYKTQQRCRDSNSMSTQRDSVSVSTIILLEIAA